jgi:hypothetical protein
MVAEAPESRFVRRVRAEIRAQNLSIRGLARRIDPEQLNRARRNLHRWLDEGIVPSTASRVVVAHALGIPTEELTDDEDDEDDPAMSLDALLRIRVRQIMREELVAA